MAYTGHCYCGEVRYEAGGSPMFQGNATAASASTSRAAWPVVIMALPEASFRWTQGTPKAFRRGDLAKPVTREF